MATFLVEATFTKTFLVEVEASDAGEAIESLDDWISDDFEPYQTDAKWDFETA